VGGAKSTVSRFCCANYSRLKITDILVFHEIELNNSSSSDFNESWQTVSRIVSLVFSLIFGEKTRFWVVFPEAVFWMYFQILRIIGAKFTSFRCAAKNHSFLAFPKVKKGEMSQQENQKVTVPYFSSTLLRSWPKSVAPLQSTLRPLRQIKSPRTPLCPVNFPAWPLCVVFFVDWGEQPVLNRTSAIVSVKMNRELQTASFREQTSDKHHNLQKKFADLLTVPEWGRIRFQSRDSEWAKRYQKHDGEQTRDKRPNVK
jgi:hypothetical protein